MSSPDPVRFASWPVPEFRLVQRMPLMPPEPEGPSPEELEYLRGLEDGRREAADAAEVRLGGAREAFAAAAASLEKERAAFALRAEECVYALATALAQQIVQREIATEPAIVHDLVRRAIDTLPIEGTLEVRLNPEDLSALGQDLDLYAAGGRRLDIRWLAEPTVQRGGFVIETPLRVVDGRVEAVLEAMFERLRHG